MSTLLTPVTQFSNSVGLTALALPAIIALLVMLILRSLMTGERIRRANEALLITGLPLGLIFLFTIALRFTETLAR